MIYIFLTKGRIQLILTFCITLDLLGTQITLGNNYLSKTVDFNHKGLNELQIEHIYVLVNNGIWLGSIENKFL